MPGEIVQMTTLQGVSSPVTVRRAAPCPAGNYLSYYANVRDHLLGQAGLMVTPQQVLQVMQVLMTGAQSAREGRCISLDPGKSNR